ncbi:MAG: type II toxin-antitoxin system VapC family toxin [Betaproteobacteria bacterium]|nr:type II toxin-antitoxin system VapC family toxin [Betaproteobacteria bacterium]MBI2290382.1 type II toxin-antitoxin system VapC family toxin [Betaproteobacteria bacterium]MBI3055906.1 type II toxin-antitoxin system VapC family toxin [Betaproteobacteria bacterium]
MKVMLDTNTCIALIKRKSPQVIKRFNVYKVGEIGISWVTLAELEFGVAKSQHQEKNQAALDEFVLPLEIANFNREAARVYGRVRAVLEKKGTPIGALDVMIGAHALSLGVTLATNNTREFSRIKGLNVVDWLDSSG